MTVFELPLSTGHTAAEQMPLRGLPAAQRSELMLRQAARLSIWEVLEVEHGRGFEAVDLLTGERARIDEQRASTQLRPRDAILCRVVQADGRRSLDGVHPARLDPRAADEVVELILAVVDRRRRRLEHRHLRTPEVALALFCAWQARTARSANEHAMHEVELRNTDGDAIEPTTDTYELLADDARAFADVLIGWPDVFEFETDDDEIQLCFVREGNAIHPDCVLRPGFAAANDSKPPAPTRLGKHFERAERAVERAIESVDAEVIRLRDTGRVAA